MARDKIKVPSNYAVVVVVMTDTPESMVLLYDKPFTNDQLKSGDIYKDVPRFQYHYGKDNLEGLKQEVRRRWPDATIYRLPRLGEGMPTVWY